MAPAKRIAPVAPAKQVQKKLQVPDYVGQAVVSNGNSGRDLPNLPASNPPKIYDPKLSEPKWQSFWDQNNIYRFDPDSKKPIFSVDTPPPTVSGRMHIGHAFSYSQADFLVRFKRMQGFNVFYPFGTDDNGLATERLVEKERKVKGSRMPRREFQAVCLDYLKEQTPLFISDWKAIGISSDWSIYYSTINDHCQRISQQSFIDLYKSGREYRKLAPSIWCPECQTAIAQVELRDEDLQSVFVDIIFTTKEGTKLIIATTRPEMLPACVAVFAHPDDDRYKNLFGRTAIVPLFGQEVPILSDSRADPEKGTGLVMCCTFGDQTDIEWYKAHNLPLKVAISKDGRMTQICAEFKDLKIRDARKAVIEKLKIKGLLVAEKNIMHAVNVHERCGVEIEILETPQWFIRYLDLKDEFLKAGDALVWHPPHMKNRFDNWVKGLQWDWCISRQRHFGVPFPVWYCAACNEPILAEESQLPVDPLEDKPISSCKKCRGKDSKGLKKADGSLKKAHGILHAKEAIPEKDVNPEMDVCPEMDVIPEKDVMDTWATSSLTPQLAVQLFKNHPVYKKLFPMTLRPQAHDIISFWLFNTVVKSQMHFKTNPFKEVAVSGWALDPKGRKMSKSLGNVIDPRVILQKFPADALRYWSAGSKLGDDMPFQEKDLVTGNKTITKLWNASKFASLHLQDFDGKRPGKLEAYDKAMLSKLARLIESSTASFEQYEYHHSKLSVDTFFWHDLCDEYLEVVKDRLYNAEQRGIPSRKSAQYVLYQSLLAVIKLFAPFMPHITEEVYQSFFKSREKSPSIHVSSWPACNKKDIDIPCEAVGNLVSYAVEQARRAKSEKNLSLKAPIRHFLIRGKISKLDFEMVKKDIMAATSCANLEYEELSEDSKIDVEHELSL